MLTNQSHNSLFTSFVLHYDGLISYVRRHFGNNHFASDVVHDVCIQIMENPPLVRIDSPLAYLKKASFNRALDRCKHEKVRSEHIASMLSEDNVHYMDGASVLEFAQKIEQVKKIIDDLPRKQRQVFLLHQLHEVSQHEIAIEMGITPNMVSRHFNKALSNITISRKFLGI